jgi:hypothetical protein
MISILSVLPVRASILNIATGSYWIPPTFISNLFRIFSMGPPMLRFSHCGPGKHLPSSSNDGISALHNYFLINQNHTILY